MTSVHRASRCAKSHFLARDRMDWIFLPREATNSYTVFLYMFSLSPQKYYSDFLVWFNSFPQKRQHLMSSPVPLMMTFETSLHQLKCWYMLCRWWPLEQFLGFSKVFSGKLIILINFWSIVNLLMKYDRNHSVQKRKARVTLNSRFSVLHIHVCMWVLKSWVDFSLMKHDYYKAWTVIGLIMLSF